MVKSKIRNFAAKSLLTLGAVAAGILTIAWVQEVIRIDPFASFRNPTSGPFGGLIALRMENVAVKYYKGKTLTGLCNVRRLDVHQDRRYVDFYQVKQAFYEGPNGRFNYDCDRAVWNSGQDRLHVLSGAHIWNADMDLQTDAFEYSQKSNLLYVPTKVKGMLFKGKVEAKKITYSLKDGSYIIGPSTWVGMASFSADDTGEAKPQANQWSFKSEGPSSHKGNTDIWVDAEATDGDIIVKAPKFERDTKTDVVTATGKVFYFSAKTNMTCEKAVIYRKEKRAVLTGNVQMILKPKDNQKVEKVDIEPFRPQVPEEIAKNRPPAPPTKSVKNQKKDDEVRSTENLRKYPVVILAENIEYWYGKGSRHAIIKGSPQARQDLAEDRWRYAWTHEAFYDGEKETLKMVSTEGKKDTRVKNSIGDDVIAEWITISTQEDNNEWSAYKMEGKVFEDDEDIPRSGGGKGTTADDKTKGKGKADDKGAGGDKTNPPIKGDIGKT